MDKYVTNRQLFFIIFLSLEAFSIIELPKLMAETAGTGSWLVIFIAMIFFVVAISIIASLNNNFQGKILFDYSNILVGKIITWIFAIVFTVYYTVLTGLIKRSIAEIIKNAFLPKTPAWAGMLVMLALTGYAATRGLANIGRIFEFFGFITIIAFSFLQTLIFFEGEFIYLEPFFDSSMLLDYAKALPLLILPFLGIEIITVIPFSDQVNKRASLYCKIGVIAVGINYILTVSLTFMMLSPDDTVYYSEPLIRAIRRVDIPSLQIFQRLDVIFVSAWFFSVFCALSMLIFVAGTYLNKLIPKSKMNWTVPIVTLVAYIIALIPQSSAAVSDSLKFVTRYVGIFPTLIIPIILFITMKVKKNAGKLP